MDSVHDPPTEHVDNSLSKNIDATPKVGQDIQNEGKDYTTIKEGLAYILVPHGIPTSTDPKLSKEETQKQQVFYNPIQQFNRDLSVLAIKTYGNDLVQRKQDRHKQRQAKANRIAERKKRKPDGEDNTTTQAGAPDLDNANSKRRKTAHTNDSDLVSRGEDTADTQPETKKGNSTLLTDAEVDGAASQPSGTAGWKPSFTILDALSATGLRALRYAKEIPLSTSITANDMSSKATESIALNVKHNKLEDKIKANTGNALVHMYSLMEKGGYDVIDLDPYGTAAPFIDAAVQAINDEGMLCVTCTDSAIFASHGYLEKTYSQYGGLPLKGEPCHEGGLRLLLHAIASSAARYGMAIEPLLSLSIDYYIRVFVKIRKSPSDVKLLAGKTMIVYHCDSGCGSWSTQFLARNKPKQNRDGTASYKHSFASAPTANEFCGHCGFKAHLSGPMYGGPLHNAGFVERILAQLSEVDRETYPTYDRIKGMLHTALEEVTYGCSDQDRSKSAHSKQLGPLIPKADPAEIDHHPFFFIPSAVSRVLHCSAPPTAAVRGALRRAGFRVTMSHCKPGSIRTDAPWSAIWHIMREWVRQKAPLKNPLKQGTAGYGIMSKENTNEGDEKPLGAATESESAALEAHQSDKKGTNVVPEKSQKDSTEKSNSSGPDFKFEVVFDEELGRDHDRGKYVRYQLAPRENWGPMSRAK